MSVFDSSAVLAIFYGEEGRDVAKKHLSAASISRVNVAVGWWFFWWETS